MCRLWYTVTLIPSDADTMYYVYLLSLQANIPNGTSAHAEHLKSHTPRALAHTLLKYTAFHGLESESSCTQQRCHENIAKTSAVAVFTVVLLSSSSRTPHVKMHHRTCTNQEQSARQA